MSGFSIGVLKTINFLGFLELPELDRIKRRSPSVDKDHKHVVSIRKTGPVYFTPCRNRFLFF